MKGLVKRNYKDVAYDLFKSLALYPFLTLAPVALLTYLPNAMAGTVLFIPSVLLSYGQINPMNLLWSWAPLAAVFMAERYLTDNKKQDHRLQVAVHSNLAQVLIVASYHFVPYLGSVAELFLGMGALGVAAQILCATVPAIGLGWLYYKYCIGGTDPIIMNGKISDPIYISCVLCLGATLGLLSSNALNGMTPAFLARAEWMKYTPSARKVIAKIAPALTKNSTMEHVMGDLMTKVTIGYAAVRFVGGKNTDIQSQYTGKRTENPHSFRKL